MCDNYIYIWVMKYAVSAFPAHYWCVVNTPVCLYRWFTSGRGTHNFTFRGQDPIIITMGLALRKWNYMMYIPRPLVNHLWTCSVAHAHDVCSASDCGVGDGSQHYSHTLSREGNPLLPHQPQTGWHHLRRGDRQSQADADDYHCKSPKQNRNT